VIGDASGDKAYELLATILRGGPSRELCVGYLVPAIVAGTKARAVKRLYDLRRLLQSARGTVANVTAHDEANKVR